MKFRPLPLIDLRQDPIILPKGIHGISIIKLFLGFCQYLYLQYKCNQHQFEEHVIIFSSINNDFSIWIYNNCTNKNDILKYFSILHIEIVFINKTSLLNCLMCIRIVVHLKNTYVN